jgi:hypothetical protein
MTRQELEEWADNLPLKFLVCRSKKHQDKLIDTRPAGRGFVMFYRCINCRRELTESINAAGLVVDRKLEYPDGYLAPKGAGRTDQNRNGMMRIRRARRFVDGKQ